MATLEQLMERYEAGAVWGWVLLDTNQDVAVITTVPVETTTGPAIKYTLIEYHNRSGQDDHWSHGMSTTWFDDDMNACIDALVGLFHRLTRRIDQFPSVHVDR